MIKKSSSDKKPLVGFFPLFYNLAESGRAVIIAKRYKELGGKAIFFSHGGKYEYLAKEIGCKVVRVKPIYTEQFIEHLWKCSRMEELRPPFSKKVLLEHVEEEIAAYKKADVKIILTTNNFPCSISARAAQIPLISVTPRIKGEFTKYPDDAEFFFTRFIPHSWKLKILNWYAPRSRIWARPFGKVAKRYPDIPSLRLTSDINKGDYNFFTDFIELLNLEKTDISANEHYIGPIFFDELFVKSFSEKNSLKEVNDIELHLQKPGKSIMISLGSSGTKELILKILETLNEADYNVIAVYGSILKEGNLPKLNDNILLKKFVPSLRAINSSVDLAILHGGQGTIYTAAYSGKPVIGFPMQFEQHLNLEMLVKHGMAIILSRKYFKKEKLLQGIDEIFNNQDKYLKNAQDLVKKLPKPEGDKNAVQKIIEILEQKGLI
ncbi:MAG: glycosyltransferase family 1 protein [Thermoplasmatales archaeon]|nr:MAG: glycosyltransferase family 1 protein [Thermoplasmatales archaeon]